MSEGRPARVAERLRAELSELFVRGRLRDPRAEGVVISAVRVTRDLSQARVYVRAIGEADARRRSDMVRALESASGFLRREIAPKLSLRRAPELTFFWDDQVDKAERLERIFAELQVADSVGKGDGDEEGTER